jgi:transcriptional regulator with XRE-family HTH domain
MRWLREKEGRRQYEIALAAGVTKAMLSAYETGKQSPSLQSLERVLEALGADLVELASALDHVNERRPRPTSLREVPGVGEAPAAGGPAPDVRTILGVEEIPGEEEAALARMLDGFHRLLRYYHRTGPTSGP